jgi:hypothetical protein
MAVLKKKSMTTKTLFGEGLYARIPGLLQDVLQPASLASKRASKGNATALQRSARDRVLQLHSSVFIACRRCIRLVQATSPYTSPPLYNVTTPLVALQVS